MVPGIQSAMLYVKKNIALARSLNQELQTRHDQLQTSIQKQDALGKGLFLKITEWNRHIGQQKELQAQQCRLFDHALKAYKLRQAAAVQAVYLQQDIKDSVCRAVEEKLQNRYISAQAQKAYLEKALDGFGRTRYE